HREPGGDEPGRAGPVLRDALDRIPGGVPLGAAERLEAGQQHGGHGAMLVPRNVESAERTRRDGGTMVECIHGLMVESCDVCSPKAPPVRPRSARVRPAPGPTVRASRAAASRPAVVNPGARRILHLTHLRNLPGILGIGRILADAAGAAPDVDLTATDTQIGRSHV